MIKLMKPPRETGKEFDGGDYYYYVTFIKTSKGYKVKYGTSSGFCYCEVEGAFQDCHRCLDWEYKNGGCQRALKVISPKKFVDMVAELKAAGYQEVSTS